MISMWQKWALSNTTPMTRLTAVGVSLACVASLATGLVARADDVTDQKKTADRKIAAIGQQLEGTSAALATAYARLQKTKAALPGARQKVAAAQQAVTAAQAAQARAEATQAAAVAAEAKARAHNEAVAQKLAVAQANEARAKEQLSKSSTALVTSQDALDAYAAEVFQGGPTQSQLGLMFGATSPQDFADRIIMADTASAVAADTIDKLAAMTADNTSTRAYLTSVRGEIAELKRQAEIALKGAEAARAAATRAKEQAIVAKNNAVTAKSNATTAQVALQSLEKQQVTFAGDLAKQKAQELKQLAAAKAEARRLQAILVERARQARLAEQRRIAAEKAKAAAAAKRGQTYVPKINTNTGFSLSYPANGPTTSGFGMRWHPVLQKWLLHDGLDWGLACGTPIYAAADGEIIRAGWRESGWGNQVLIDHGIHRGVDLVTSYNHLSSIVRWGGTVKRGQLIAYSGTTGYSTGCHLHFGTYQNGTPVNPRNWL